MDSQHWLVVILLGTSLSGVIAYLIVLGRRLKRLKQILAQSPREPVAPVLSAHPGKKGPSSTRRGGAPVGLALAQEADWADETIATQRPVSNVSALAPHETGASLVERAGSSPASTVGQAAPAGSTEGDLLKKLLTFDSGRAGAGDSSEPSPPAPSAEAPRPAPGRASELMGLLASKQAPASAVAGQPAPPVTMGRLGAFMAKDVGAPESAKVKPIPVVSGPSFSLGGPAPAASGGDAPARRSPLDLMKGGGASPSSRDRGVSVAQVLGEPGAAQSSLLGGAEHSEGVVPHAPAPEPPAAPARDSSIMSRLGGLSGGSPRLAGTSEGGPLAATASALRLTRPTGEAGAGQSSPLSSLMGRLGGATGESSSTPFTLDSLKSAGAERGPAPAAGPVSPTLRFGLERPNERPVAGGSAGGALQRLSQLSRTAPTEPAGPAVPAPIVEPPPASTGMAGSLAALSRLSLKPASAASPGPTGAPRVGGLQLDRLKALASSARPAEPPSQPAPEPAAAPSDAAGPAKKKLVLNFKTLGSAR